MKNISLKAKEEYNHYPGDADKVKTYVVDNIKKKLTELGKNLKNFTFPIHSSYFAKGFCYKKTTVFGSKMVPVLIAGRSSESKDDDEDDTKNVFQVIYKCGMFYLLYLMNN